MAIGCLAPTVLPQPGNVKVGNNRRLLGPRVARGPSRRCNAIVNQKTSRKKHHGCLRDRAHARCPIGVVAGSYKESVWAELGRTTGMGTARARGPHDALHR